MVGAAFPLFARRKTVREAHERARAADGFNRARLGNRVHYSINAIGGVRRDLTPIAIERTKHILNDLEKLSDEVIAAVENHTSRLSNIGVLQKEKATAAGVVGPVLRASGIARDIRKDDPYAAYDEVDFDIKVEDSCDVLGRALVRAKETYESMKIIRQLFDRLSKGELLAEVGKPREGEGTSRVEAPRGELIYYIRSNGTNIPQRVKLRPPTYMNDHAVVEMLRGKARKSAVSSREFGSMHLVDESCGDNRRPHGKEEDCKLERPRVRACKRFLSID